MDLNLIWFGLLGVLLVGYAILDGFDLGVASCTRWRAPTGAPALHQCHRPIWDGTRCG